jgi:hypothetical protein
MSTSTRSRTAGWLLAGSLALGLSAGLCGTLPRPALALPVAAGSIPAHCVEHAASQPCVQVCEPVAALSPERAALVPPAFAVAPPSPRQLAVAGSRESSLLPSALASPSPPLYVLFLKLLL